ncbi:molybdopterin molybdotransferase MoeA [Erythrobacter sp. SCSIO 43205]|uniref:molybdopterin molybdotransferase MoeA n=1 Tax=Erythrobacter sp. SCSIO 43205 TaxID=2779361 RepID=UPI001CA860EA|nr:molybdopterin molybdotransferase MoeA [Erythrobacter sp. SCSIO 43205]UAB77222.1 molybdopterin molybdotransferase MoeA [Erythrobacter sp. SCSIO 43205]
MASWLDLAEAQAQLLALAPKMASEQVAVEGALGRVLAGNVNAARTQPPADLSAMDGYAIAGDGPWRIVGESRAGAPFGGALGPGEAVRISTGAHMPAGGESVLIQENAVRNGDRLSADATPEAGRHIRRQGFDYCKGDTLLGEGAVLGPGQIALAIAGGHATVPVAKRPKVAVLDSGDELASDPAHVRDDQIPASNGTMIAAMLTPLVGTVERIGPVADDMGAMANALGRASDCDILITSGGASVGDHDLVQDALREWGCEIAFWKVAIKPGKPLMVATREAEGRHQIVLGLPGNPVSSFVTAYLFALPLMRASMGIEAPLPSPQTRVAGEAFPAGGPRREFVRAISDGEKVVSAASQDSSALGSLAISNCLVEREPNAPEVAIGEPITVYSLQNGGFAGV